MTRDRKVYLPLFSVCISQRRLAVYTAYCVFFLATAPLLFHYLPQAELDRALLLVYVLGLLIPICIVFGRRIDLVEPLYWFSAMYYLVVPVAFYSLLTEFARSEHLLDVGITRLSVVVEQALLLFIVGYGFFLLGYLARMQERGERYLAFPSKEVMADWVTRLAVALAICIGIANFFYILMQYPRGMIEYILDFGMRAHRYEEISGPITTFGYQFLYAGIFLWFVLLRRRGTAISRSLEGWTFMLAAIASIVVSLSQGRLTQTVTYMLILAFLGYVMSVGRTRNYLYLLVAFLGLMLGIVFYFMRRISVLAYGDPEALGAVSFTEFGSAFTSALGFWLVDKGNLPNLAVVVNLVEQGGIEGSLWYGRSLILWVLNFSDWFGDTANVGQSLGAAWFTREGGLPPTVVGELYLNFGFVGVPLGLFVIGLSMSSFYGWVRRKGDIILYIIYLAVLFKFLFIWPKGETSNLVGAVWQFVPTVLVFLLIRAFSTARRVVGGGVGSMHKERRD